MSTDHVLEELSATEQFVLLGVVELTASGETPAQTHELRRCCRTRASETEVVGAPTEADVMRSLYRLESLDAVTECTGDSSSPVGKGRPSYELAIDPETVFDQLEDHSPLEGLVSELRESLDVD